MGRFNFRGAAGYFDPPLISVIAFAMELASLIARPSGVARKSNRARFQDDQFAALETLPAGAAERPGRDHVAEIERLAFFRGEVDFDFGVAEAAGFVAVDVDLPQAEALVRGHVVVGEQPLAVREQAVQIPERVEGQQLAVQPPPAGFCRQKIARAGGFVEQVAKRVLRIGAQRVETPERILARQPVQRAVVGEGVVPALELAGEGVRVGVRRRRRTSCGGRGRCRSARADADTIRGSRYACFVAIRSAP